MFAAHSISKMANTDLVTKKEMTPGVSDGHVISDVT